MSERQGDQTLLDFDIIYQARRNGLLSPFDEKRLKGASYDLRAGDWVWVVRSQQDGGYDKLSLKDIGEIIINPGQTVTIYSLERINLSNDMKARISLRSHWAIKGLYFNGGIVDPGYTGILFFNVTNLGTSPITIEYGAGLVTIEFVRMDQPSQRLYNDGEIITDVPTEKLPPLPEKPPVDLQALQSHLLELENKLLLYEKKLAQEGK